MYSYDEFKKASSRLSPIDKIGSGVIALIIMLALFITMFGPGCSQSNTSQAAPEDKHEVTKLFTVDGCTVYSFKHDSRLHYFCNCDGSTLTTVTEDAIPIEAQKVIDEHILTITVDSAQ